jgi:hypothetical protein
VVKKTGISFSGSLIFASTNPKYDDGLFIELRVQYKRIARSEQFNEQSFVMLWVS